MDVPTPREKAAESFLRGILTDGELFDGGEWNGMQENVGLKSPEVNRESAGKLQTVSGEGKRAIEAVEASGEICLNDLPLAMDGAMGSGLKGLGTSTLECAQDAETMEKNSKRKSAELQDERSVSSQKFRFFSLRGLNSFLIDNSEGPLVKEKSFFEPSPLLSKKLSSSHKRNNSSLSVAAQCTLSCDSSDENLIATALQNEDFSLRVLSNRRLFVTTNRGCALALFSVIASHPSFDQGAVVNNVRFNSLQPGTVLHEEIDALKRKKSLTSRSGNYGPVISIVKHNSGSNSASQLQDLVRNEPDSSGLPSLTANASLGNNATALPPQRKSASVSFAPYLASAGTLEVDAPHTTYTVFLSHFEAVHRLSGAQPTHNVNSYAHFSTSFHVLNTQPETVHDGELLLRELDVSLAPPASANSGGFIGSAGSANASLSGANATLGSVGASPNFLLQAQLAQPAQPAQLLSSFANPFHIPPILLLRSCAVANSSRSSLVLLNNGRKLLRHTPQGSTAILPKSGDRRRTAYKLPKGQSTFVSSTASALTSPGSEPVLYLDEDGLEVYEYEPNFFDDPELKTGKHRTVVTLPFFIGSLLHHTNPSVIKRELNEVFKATHPTVDPTLTLSHIRSLKRQLVQVAIFEDIELSSVAIAIVYFEKLALKGLIGKSNRKLIAGICLLLATKINDPKELDQAKIIKAISKQFDLSAKSVTQNEISVWAALEFSLYIPKSEIIPHLERVVVLAELNNLEEYFGCSNFYSTSGNG